MPLESDEEEYERQEDKDEEEADDVIFEFIRKVEGRPLIYNSRDKNHSKRDMINNAWKEIAAGMEYKGKKVDDAWCRKKWKTLRDYHRSTKRTLKSKSGDAANNKKPWVYFNEMDRVLSLFIEENENTQSNFPGDDSSCIENEPPTPSDNSNNNDRNDSDSLKTARMESTPTGRLSNKRVQKRKSDANEQLLTEKILKVLEEPEEVKDQFYHFGMTICNRLRGAPPQTAEYAMIKISSLLYEIMYPVQEYSANQTPSNESTHDDLIIINDNLN